MHTAHQRPHICRGTGTSDEDKIASQSFSAQTSFVEQIPWTRHNALCRQQHNVQRHQQTGRRRQRWTERHAHGTAARNAGKRAGDPGIRLRQLFIGRLPDDSGKFLQDSGKLRIDKLRRPNHDSSQIFRELFNRLADKPRRILAAFNGRYSFPCVGFKSVGEF